MAEIRIDLDILDDTLARCIEYSACNTSPVNSTAHGLPIAKAIVKYVVIDKCGYKRY